MGLCSHVTLNVVIERSVNGSNRDMPGIYLPCSIGYIPGTMDIFGKQLVALVVAPLPLIADSVIEVRPIGAIKLDESVKILTLPVARFNYDNINDFHDLPKTLTEKIEKFFKQPQKNHIQSFSWLNLACAKKVISICSESFYLGAQLA